jgi:hypothetical protein
MERLSANRLSASLLLRLNLGMENRKHFASANLKASFYLVDEKGATFIGAWISQKRSRIERMEECILAQLCHFTSQSSVPSTSSVMGMNLGRQMNSNMSVWRTPL